MALQMSVAVRNAVLDQIAATIGISAQIQIFTGAVPANCATTATGTLLATFTLAADWWAAAASGAKVLNGLPLTVSAVASGIAGYFRILASDGVTCGIQGYITANGANGDMTLDNVNIALSQSVQITGFTLTAPGA